MDAVTDKLTEDGVRQFADAFDALLKAPGRRIEEQTSGKI